MNGSSTARTSTARKSFGRVNSTKPKMKSFLIISRIAGSGSQQRKTATSSSALTRHQKTNSRCQFCFIEHNLHRTRAPLRARCSTIKVAPMNPVYITSGLYLLAVAFCLLALMRRGAYEHLIVKIENAFARFAARPIASVAALFLSFFLLRVALLPLLPVPTPEVHDEFSFLLLGDTIAHGRLSNPTPALWKSFETFHENMYPTYCSKYAPAQGAVLALGEKLGNPWIGVLLSCALMVAIFHWALRAWIPPRWSFLAALLVGLKLGLTSYWMNSFWGGAVAALAGALALGGLGRILKRPSLIVRSRWEEESRSWPIAVLTRGSSSRFPLARLFSGGSPVKQDSLRRSHYASERSCFLFLSFFSQALHLSGITTGERPAIQKSSPCPSTKNSTIPAPSS